MLGSTATNHFLNFTLLAPSHRVDITIAFSLCLPGEESVGSLGEPTSNCPQFGGGGRAYGVVPVWCPLPIKHSVVSADSCHFEAHRCRAGRADSRAPAVRPAGLSDRRFPRTARAPRALAASARQEFHDGGRPADGV